MKRRRFLASIVIAAALLTGCAPSSGAMLVRVGPFAVRVGQQVQQEEIAPVALPVESIASVAPTVPIAQSTNYQYIGPPTISRDVYVGVFCQQNGPGSAVCQQAPAMYDAIVAAGADPALELAHAGNESSFGQGGVGMAPWFNLHGIHGHGTTNGGKGTPFENHAPGDENMQRYDNYSDAVLDWIWLIKDGGLYFPERNTPEQVLEIYCECPGPTGKADYVVRMKAQIDGWRAQSIPSPIASVALQGVVSAPISLEGDCGWNVLVALDANGGALRNVTILPGETFSFNASVGNPDRSIVPWRYCAGVEAGNWCNLAARYAQAARLAGVPDSAIQFLHHNVDLGAGIDNDVLIWNIGGESGFDDGRQDLLITNPTNLPLRFEAQQLDASTVAIAAHT